MTLRSRGGVSNVTTVGSPTVTPDRTEPVGGAGVLHTAMEAAPTAAARLFTPTLAVIPLVSLYATPVAGVPLSKPVLVVSILIAAASMRSRVAPSTKWPLNLVYWLAVSTLGALMLASEVALDGVMRRFVVLLIWALAIRLCIPRLVDTERLVNQVVTIAVVATCYLFAQYLWVSVGNGTLPNVLEVGPLVANSSGYVDSEALDMYYDAFYYRPASFFGEPQYYSDYALLALILVLFRKAKRRLLPVVTVMFLTVGLLVSTSTTAILAVFGVWAAWFLVPFAQSRAGRGLSLRLLAGVLAPFAIYLVLSLPNLQEVLFDKLTDLETSARVGGSFSKLRLLEGESILLGVGIGNEDALLANEPSAYVNSVTSVLLGAGAVGAVLLLTYWYRLLRVPGLISRVVTVAYIVLSLTGSMLYSDRSLLYLAVVALFAHASPNDSALDLEPVDERA